MTYSYQWQRCDSGGGSCVPVAGATASSYLLVSGDVGKTMRISVTASNTAGSATASSSPTAVVAGTPSPTGVIDDMGTVRLGSSGQYMTNGNKYANVLIGGSYSTFDDLTGHVLKYVSGMMCYADDVQNAASTCRSNGWLVHNGSGQELTIYNGYPMANSGNVAYQNSLKTRMMTFLAAHPFIDGIYFDHFFCDVGSYGKSYPLYDQSNHLLWSSNADFQASQISFIRNIGGALKAAGYQVDVNAKCFHKNDPASNYSTPSKGWMDQYAPYVTAAAIEYWQQRADTHTVFLTGDDTWDHHWNDWQTIQPYARSKGIEFWPFDYIAQTGELPQCRYLRGSYLLEWDGHGSINFIPWSLSSDIWNTCTAFDPGTPTGTKYQVATGVWRRDFTGGYVVVNPTRAAVTVGGVSISSGDAILHQS
jgi:hypothetical protein